MKKPLSRLVPVSCFLFMPVLILLLVGAIKLGIATPDTQVPDYIAGLINWRVSSTTFLVTLIGGSALCLALMLYMSKYQDEHGFSSKAQGAFSLAIDFVAKNFYFWSGNFLAYTIGSYSLEFIKPISLQVPMIFFMLLAGLAIKFLSELIKNSASQTHQ